MEQVGRWVYKPFGLFLFHAKKWPSRDWSQTILLVNNRRKASNLKGLTSR